MATAAEILYFWFLTPVQEAAYLNERMPLWFRKDARTDQLLRERFGPDIRAAVRGELADWEPFSKNRLALILLLDQMTRNIYRDTPAAFSGDPRALALTLDGLEKGHDQRLQPAERIFFYMPLQHSEDVALQERSIELYTALAAEVPAEVRSTYESCLDFAGRHRDIVARFGRFPHRNAILGRPSTDEELAFLEQPGSSF